MDCLFPRCGCIDLVKRPRCCFAVTTMMTVVSLLAITIFALGALNIVPIFAISAVIIPSGASALIGSISSLILIILYNRQVEKPVNEGLGEVTAPINSELPNPLNQDPIKIENTGITPVEADHNTLEKEGSTREFLYPIPFLPPAQMIVDDDVPELHSEETSSQSNSSEEPVFQDLSEGTPLEDSLVIVKKKSITTRSDSK